MLAYIIMQNVFSTELRTEEWRPYWFCNTGNRPPKTELYKYAKIMHMTSEQPLRNKGMAAILNELVSKNNARDMVAAILVLQYKESATIL